MLKTPWPELDQLCGSGPFKLFCGSSLPTADQRLICTACGLPQTGMDQRSTCTPPGSHPGEHALHRPAGGCCRPHTSAQMWPDTPPEQRHEQMGHPPWEAPYVWETDYL